MNYRAILLSFTGIVCLFACNEKKKPTSATQIIVNGQMPAIAKDADNNIHLVYGSGDSLLYCFIKKDNNSFSSPMLIDTLKNLMSFATRGPQIAATKNGVVVIAVNKNGNIYSFKKNSNGQWKRTAKINDVDSVNAEGFAALSGNENVNLFAIWTDVRNDKHNKIYGAASTNGGLTWSKNILVYASPDSSICECCKPSVAMKESNVYVMFRNWLNGNRDLYLIKSADEGRHFDTAQKLGTGSWKLNGCPMDGGGLSIAKDGTPQTVWRRENIIYEATPLNAEKKIGEGKGCSIEIINGKNVYAFSNANGNIVCVLPGGSKKILGKGMLPVLKSINEKNILCVWQNAQEINYRIIKI